MSISDLQMTVYTLELTEETLTNQLTDNSTDLRLEQKHSSSEIEKIRAKYAPEKEYINDQIESLDKTEQREEYQDLLAELNDLKEQEEREVAQVEDQQSDNETLVQLENETTESRLEDVKAQKESFQEMLKQNIEKGFGYFQ